MRAHEAGDWWGIPHRIDSTEAVVAGLSLGAKAVLQTARRPIGTAATFLYVRR